MNTYFARHTRKLLIDDMTRKRLWDERRIAIHFPQDADGVLGEKDNPSLLPEDYGSRASGRIQALNMLAELGGYVCAEHCQENDVQVGYVVAGSAVELLEGHWSPDSDYPGRPAIMKTIRLTNVRLLDSVNAAIALAGRPRMGTFQRWYECRTRIEDLVEGTERKIGLSDLVPCEQETMCAEFLRMPEAELLGLPRLVHLLLPVGRTMRDLDIIGVASDGRRIQCQVTYLGRAESSSKMDAIRKFSKAGAHWPIFFCITTDCSDYHDVRVVSLQAVFEAFEATPSGKLWLSAIRPSIRESTA